MLWPGFLLICCCWMNNTVFFCLYCIFSGFDHINDVHNNGLRQCSLCATMLPRASSRVMSQQLLLAWLGMCWDPNLGPKRVVCCCALSTHGKHQLFLEEHALLKALSNSSCSVDTMFQLNFDIKSKTATLKSNNNQISITLFPSEDFDVQGTTLSLPHPTAPSSQGSAWPAANGLQWSDALACGQSVWVDVARLQPFQA